MVNNLTRFTIKGLHGRTKLDVKFDDNLLILVGENGSGKTTFLRILFNFLSGHWLSLVQFKFESITAQIGPQEFNIQHDWLVKALKDSDRRFLGDIPPTIRRRVMQLLDAGEFERASYEMTRYGGRYFPPGGIIQSELLLRQLEIFEEKPKGAKKDLQLLNQRLRDSLNAQILYLPTYRRIERELGSIFQGVDSEEFRKNKARSKQIDSDAAYIELVEFGMKDVQAAIDRSLAELKDFARESLNNLTLRYLGDVVNRDYQNVSMEFSTVSELTVSSVLDRIQDSILSAEHKRHVFEVINSARSAKAPTEHDKIIYHYFLKLLHFQESLQSKEAQISEFCALCSEYIVDKRFVYDGTSFTFSIEPKNWVSVEPIDLGDLSSGEKQIVSLFSHLYLSGQKRFFVLIDEPELSLSVPWQRRFLQDIKKSQFCTGLVAVTHSPFIYDNELSESAHSIDEFLGG